MRFRNPLVLIALALPACFPEIKFDESLYDLDGDGYAGTEDCDDDDPSITTECIDGDGDGFDASEDCDDGDASVSPAGAEICDGIDNDCDGEIDEEVTTTWYADADDDGYGDPTAPAEMCGGEDGFVPIATDCDDDDPNVNPGAEEVCDDIDNDCDGSELTETVYADTDDDGHGDAGTPYTLAECGAAIPPGYVRGNDDCNDDDENTYPGATEVCDGLTNDCNDTTAEPDAGLLTWYSFQDSDGDGEGTPLIYIETCQTPTGYSLNPLDCNDGDPTETSTSGDFLDADGDGVPDCADVTIYEFNPDYALGDSSDWLVDNGDGTYSPTSDYDLCGYTDSGGSYSGPFGSVNTSSSWSVDSNGYLVEQSNHSCGAVSKEFGALETVTVSVDYNVPDTNTGGVWVGLSDGGTDHFVATLTFPHYPTPPVGLYYFDESVGEYETMNKVTDAAFAVPTGTFTVHGDGSYMDATIGGSGVTVDDASYLSGAGVAVGTSSIAIGSWDNDQPLSVYSISVINAAGWEYNTSTGFWE